MNFEEIKQNWNKAQLNIELLKQDNLRLAQQLVKCRVQTARDKLASYYIRSMSCAVLMPLLAPTLVISTHMPIWVASLYGLFGIIMGVINYLFYRYIKRCDYTSLPTVEALSMAVNIARYQRYIRSFGIFASGALIATMFYLAIDRSEYNMVVAFIIGLAVGLALGLIKFLRMSALVKQMQNELRSLLEDE